MLWVALISICLVFLVLVLLVWVMKLFGYVFTRRQAAATAAANKSAVVPGQIHDEEIAAIATALKLYRSALHDRESEVLTIMSIKRAYSPWNSKIHGLTPLPERKLNDASTVAHVVVNGTAYEVEIEGAKTSAASRPQVMPAPKNANSAMITPATASPSPRIAPSAPSSGYAVKCPLPGTVLSVKVQVGDKVASGQTLVVLEAMKMENNIDADRAGVVKEVCIQQGATVMEGDNLIVIE